MELHFDETLLNDNILDALWDMHFDMCTPIQAGCIDPIIEGRDIMGVAQTGTGKTAAYLLPVLSMLDDASNAENSLNTPCDNGQNANRKGRVFPDDAVNCLIMAPTRELAQQIDQAMQGFAYYLDGISSVAVYGGNDGNRYYQEVEALRKGASVIIATPGRLISHMQMGNLDLSRLSFFILDEADRMLDMGFSEDIMMIAKQIGVDPKTGLKNDNSCQIIMFSATMPDDIDKLAHTLLHDPLNVRIAISKPPEKIQQSAYVCYAPQKLMILKDINKNGFTPVACNTSQDVETAQSYPLKRCIIFSGKKARVKEISAALHQAKVNCGAMHSDLSQAERDDIMFRFKSGQIEVLVATDIVARGIDIDDIQMVINYDVPHDVEDYVHRIGRTARAERDGVAITLVSEEDTRYFQKIERFLGKTIQKNSLPDGIGEAPQYHAASHNKKDNRRSKHSGHGRNKKKVQGRTVRHGRNTV